MIVDKFTKFLLSVIAIFLCLNTLNLRLSPPLVNAEATKAYEKYGVSNNKALDELARTVDKWAKLQIENYEQTKYAVPDSTMGEAVLRMALSLEKIARIDEATLHQLYQGTRGVPMD